MKTSTKILVALSAIGLSAGAFAHWTNASDMMEQFEQLTPEQMQEWHDQMVNNPQRHAQFSERMHKNFSEKDFAAMRAACPGMGSGMGMGHGMKWQQSDSSSK